MPGDHPIEHAGEASRAAGVDRAGGRKSKPHWRLLYVVAIATAAAAGVLVLGGELVRWLESRALRTRPEVTAVEPVADYWYPYPSKGVTLPEHLAAAAGTNAADDEPIIGVVVNGQAHAYLLTPMRDRNRHVVNDAIAGTAVTATYCDLTDCVRVYTDPASTAPLAIALAGLNNGEMVVAVDGVKYLQRSGDPLNGKPGAGRLPYAALEYERTTWGAWKARHPGTTFSR
jgi:hypothetical protein